MKNGGEERDSALRKHGRPHARHFPSEVVRRMEAELVREKGVFALQELHVRILRGIGRQESALTEKEGLNGCQGVAMLAYKDEGKTKRKTLKRVAVDAETEVACKSYIASAFPIAVVPLFLRRMAVMCRRGTQAHHSGVKIREYTACTDGEWFLHWNGKWRHHRGPLHGG